MTRKVRHPYQIMEAEELVVGEQYMFVNAYRTSLGGSLYTFGGIINDNQSIIKNPPVTLPPTVTIHPTGLNSNFNRTANPSLIYWRSLPGSIDYDLLSTYLGESLCTNRSIVVPLKHWEDDPRFYYDVIERKIGQTTKVGMKVDMDWEQKMRAKRDAAMAKALGF